MANAIKKSKNSLINVESLIIELRGQKVILDSDVARIYKVETKRINAAVQRNKPKFPRGYVFDLREKEWELLKSHFATSKGGKVKRPKAFTEKGLYMLATVLNSTRATRATIQIIETFANIKEFGRVARELAESKDKAQQQKLVEQSGSLMGSILNQEFADDVSSETSITLNLALLKVKHTIKKSKKS